MSPGGRDGPVVVAVDEACSAGEAVDWASAEAAARGCRLRIVHAVRPPLQVDPYCLTPSAGVLAGVSATAEQVLGAAAARVRSIASDLEVSTALVRRSPPHTLLAEADRACLLVLGRRTRSGLRGRLVRSVSAQVTAHARCPVVVVRDARDAGVPGPSPPRVVVGVEEGASSAIGFAFHAARQRGLPLSAVHAWTPDPPADLEAACAPPDLAEALAGLALDRALVGWAAEFPDVPVHTTLVCGAPARVLIARSRGAALLVLGSRRGGHLPGAVLGPVGRLVLGHGTGPLAVVHDPPTAGSPATPGRRAGRRAAPWHRRHPT